MTIDVLFSSLLAEDVPSIKKSLEEIVNKKDVVYVVEGNFIPINHKVLLGNDFQKFLQHYEIDINSKKALDNSTNEELKAAFSELYDEGFRASHADQGLYRLATEKGWSIKHEIIHPRLLFEIQRTYSLMQFLPYLFKERGLTSEYTQKMRENLENQRKFSYAREADFLELLKSFDKEEKQVVSVRERVYNFLRSMFDDQGINFYGFEGISDVDPVTKMVHKNLLLQEITDEELIAFYVEMSKK